MRHHTDPKRERRLIIVCYLVFAGICKNALSARTFYDNQVRSLIFLSG